MRRILSDDERWLLNHLSMWGSDGYPLHKLQGNRWVWGPVRSIQGPPVVFKTKREAVESFEAFHRVLINAYGEEAQEKALAEIAK